MFSIYLSLKSSRFWAACSSNTTCYPLFPHQLQPCSPPVPLGDLPSFQQETSPWDRCLLRSCSGSVPDLLFSGRIQRRTLKTKRYPGNFAPGGGEGVKLLNSHFSAENIERNSEEFGWGAAEGARVQIPQGVCISRMKPLRLILQGRKQAVYPWVFTCAPWEIKAGGGIKRQTAIGWWGIPLAQRLIKFGLPCREADLSVRLPKRD